MNREYMKKIVRRDEQCNTDDNILAMQSSGSVEDKYELGKELGRYEPLLLFCLLYLLKHSCK